MLEVLKILVRRRISDFIRCCSGQLAYKCCCIYCRWSNISRKWEFVNISFSSNVKDMMGKVTRIGSCALCQYLIYCTVNSGNKQTNKHLLGLAMYLEMQLHILEQHIKKMEIQKRYDVEGQGNG